MLLLIWLLIWISGEFLLIPNRDIISQYIYSLRYTNKQIRITKKTVAVVWLTTDIVPNLISQIPNGLMNSPVSFPFLLAMIQYFSNTLNTHTHTYIYTYTYYSLLIDT